MSAPELWVFAVTCLAGLGLELWTAGRADWAEPRARLNATIARLTAVPSKLWVWYAERRERNYQPHDPSSGSQRSTWVYRAHFFVLTPLAAYLCARWFENLAAGHRPIGGMYLSPDAAWYFGAVAGLVMAALAPLLAVIAFAVVIALPLAMLNFAAKGVLRLLQRLTGSEDTPTQAPFLATGVIVGVLAGILILLARL